MTMATAMAPAPMAMAGAHAHSQRQQPQYHQQHHRPMLPLSMYSPGFPQPLPMSQQQCAQQSHSEPQRVQLVGFAPFSPQHPQHSPSGGLYAPVTSTSSSRSQEPGLGGNTASSAGGGGIPMDPLLSGLRAKQPSPSGPTGGTTPALRAMQAALRSPNSSFPPGAPT